jgi:hypothetical protein
VSRKAGGDDASEPESVRMCRASSEGTACSSSNGRGRPTASGAPWNPGSELARGSLAAATTVRWQQSRSLIDACFGAGAKAGSAPGQQSGITSPVSAQRISRWLEAAKAKTSTGATSSARNQRVDRAFGTKTG